MDMQYLLGQIQNKLFLFQGLSPVPCDTRSLSTEHFPDTRIHAEGSARQLHHAGSHGVMKKADSETTVIQSKKMQNASSSNDMEI